MFLIENPAFIPEYSAFKNLKVLASINSKATDDEIKEVLEQVGLDPNDKKIYKKIFSRYETKARYCQCCYGQSKGCFT